MKIIKLNTQGPENLLLSGSSPYNTVFKNWPGKKLFDMGFGSEFLGMTQPITTKNKQDELHQTRKLLHRKENHQQNEKVTYGMRENTCKSCSDMESISKIYIKNLYDSITKVTTIIIITQILKWAKDLTDIFSKKIYERLAGP